MTLREIEQSGKMFLVPADIAPLLGVNAHSIRVQAHDDPSKLGFPVIVAGTRTRIPRVPFLNFIKNGLITEEVV